MATGEEKLRLVLAAIDRTAAPIRAVNRRIERMTSPVRKVRNALAGLAREARFDKLASGAAKLGRSLGRAALRIGGLAAAAASYIGLRFAKAGIEAAAAYETLGVRLKVLTGNAEGARKVLAGIDALAVRTPFSLEELGSVAASMSVIFKGNTDKVAEFTGLAADLAAAYGRPVEQIGENLQRAFSAGLGSADVLREAGISAEILRITGASKASEVSQLQLAEALRTMAGEGGTAFKAAANQADTLAGSISNTAIAFGNVQRSLGQALGPLLNRVLLETAIPALERMRALVEGNAEAIGTGLRQAIGYVVSVWGQLVAGFEKGYSAVRGVSDSSGSLGETLSRLGAVVSRLFETLGGWERVGQIVGLAVGVIANAIELLALGLEKLFGFVDKISPKLGAFAETISPFFSGAIDLGSRIFGGGGGEEDRGSAIATRAPGANVGGRIQIELDDRRARVKSTETSSPGVALEMASGQALAPA